jgi:hypothetical protein
MSRGIALYAFFALVILATKAADSQHFSSTPPAQVIGSWRICGTKFVTEVTGAKSTWNTNPIGKKITFMRGGVIFSGKKYPVLDYRMDRLGSTLDFEATYGAPAEALGVRSGQTVVTANFVNRNLKGVVTSEVYPIRSDYIILNWDQWFLFAVPSRMKCTAVKAVDAR